MNHNHTLEFDTILNQLTDYAVSENAKAKLLALRPSLSERECRMHMRETTEARLLLDACGTPPLTSMLELNKSLHLAASGAMLSPTELLTVAQFLSSCRRMKAYLKKSEELNTSISGYGGALIDLSALHEEIDRSIRAEMVDDNASTELRSLRRRLENAQSAVKVKLDDILRSKRDWFADNYVTTRAGRFVLPVKREFKNQFGGTVVEISNSGGTCFMEPSSVRKLQEEISMLQLEEDNEVRKILYTLTALVDENSREIKLCQECMETLDFLFAKARLSADMGASPVPLTTDRRIIIRQGRHPLISRQQCVPLDFEIGGGVTGIVITGPNTGGKTVSIKTVGLLSLMAQSGLHVPVGDGSSFCMNANVLCDIGDGQSISENLSTFSAHLTNIIRILGDTTAESLVLLDELGSGTDPAEGMGLAIAVLEELRKRGCLFVATTHYPEVKDFAAHAAGLLNARMAFDRESLQPLYRLEIGEAGESCALYIAKRLGFPEHLLEHARAAAYGSQQHTAPCEAQIYTACSPTEASVVPAAHSGKPQPSVIRREIPETEQPGQSFGLGDSVIVHPQKALGIVCRVADSKGMIGVQMKGEKQLINHKRLRLQTPASELYPDDYDFSIIFDTVENRKARHRMGKGHQPGLTASVEIL